MFLPPAAAWTVDSARWQRRVLVALGLAGALPSLFFCLNQRWGAHSLAVLLWLGLCTVGASWRFQKAANGQLRWDGERWHWSDSQDYAVTKFDCVVDLQRFLLLRIVCDQGPQLWLWLYSPAMDGRWLALRRAVMAAQQGGYRPQTGSLPE